MRGLKARYYLGHNVTTRPRRQPHHTDARTRGDQARQAQAQAQALAQNPPHSLTSQLKLSTPQYTPARIWHARRPKRSVTPHCCGHLQGSPAGLARAAAASVAMRSKSAHFSGRLSGMTPRGLAGRGSAPGLSSLCLRFAWRRGRASLARAVRLSPAPILRFNGRPSAVQPAGLNRRCDLIRQDRPGVRSDSCSTTAHSPPSQPLPYSHRRRLCS